MPYWLESEMIAYAERKEVVIRKLLYSLAKYPHTYASYSALFHVLHISKWLLCDKAH